MTKAEIEAFFSRLDQLKILVVGDVMTDAYAWGHTERMSPEAPVPVVQIQRTENRPGGAANVALNLLAMGVQVRLVSLVGTDEAGTQLREMMTAAGVEVRGLIASADRPTTIKTRIMSGKQQLLRIDHESTVDANAQESTRIWEAFCEAADGVDAVIFQDYDKGVLHTGNIAPMLSHCAAAGIPTAVDPKKRNFFAYKSASLFKPNLKELGDALDKNLHKHDEEGINEALGALRQRLSPEAILLTLSEAGVMYSAATETGHIPAHIRTIADVSGAGDTVISVAGCCLAAKLPIAHLAALSNLAGGLVCESLGVVPIKRDKLLAEALQNAE